MPCQLTARSIKHMQRQAPTASALGGFMPKKETPTHPVAADANAPDDSAFKPMLLLLVPFLLLLVYGYFT